MNEENNNNSGRTRLELPADDYLISDFATKMGEALRPEPIFTKDSIVVYLNRKDGKLREMTSAMFRTWVEKTVSCHRVGDKGKLIDKTMQHDVAAAVLASEQFRAQLRPIVWVDPIPLPIIRDDQRLEVLSQGYDEQSRTFTISGIHYSKDTPLEEAKRIIEELLSEFTFAHSEYAKAVSISAMLTLVASHLLPPKTLRPCYIYVANNVGAGKTTLAKLAIIPACGDACVQAQIKSPEEIRKLIAATIKEGKSYLLLDNFKGNLNLAPLEAVLSSSKISERLLGKSETFEAENTVTIFITGNDLTITPDMRRRSLIVELWSLWSRPEEREYKGRLTDNSIEARRAEILGALYAMISSWHSAGCPKSRKTISSFPEWSEIIGGILEHCGMGSLSNPPKSDMAKDQDSDDMAALLELMEVAKRYQFDELTKLCIEDELFTHLGIAVYEGGLPRSIKIKIGKFLSKQDGVLFPIGDRRIRFRCDGKLHAKRYWIEPAEES